MDGINRIIERNIKKAIDQGTFDDLPGKGKVQQFADLRFIPPEQRTAFLALRIAFAGNGDYEYVFYVTNTAYSNDLTPNGFEV